MADNSYKYLTTEEMKGLGDDSMQIDVTNDEKEKKESINRWEFPGFSLHGFPDFVHVQSQSKLLIFFIVSLFLYIIYLFILLSLSQMEISPFFWFIMFSFMTHECLLNHFPRNFNVLGYSNFSICFI